jgi:allantoinase
LERDRLTADTPPVFRSRRVVTPEGVRPAALHIHDGMIRRVAAWDDVPRGVAVEDVGDLVLMPGLVDTHVHMNEPGRTEWEGFETATRAAAAGGVTTLLDMPLNSVPATTSVAGLEAKRLAARGKCTVDVGFIGGVVPGNAHELAPLRAAGVLAFKCFLVDSGVEEFPGVHEDDLREAFPVLATLGVPLMVHAEHPAHIVTPPRNGSRSYATYLASRPPAAEGAAIEMLVRLVEWCRVPIHIVHLSSAEGLGVVRAARSGGLPITAETCPHYLTFAADEIPDGATAYKCAPPIRSAVERDALWQGLLRGDLDMVVSDHSPAPPALKDGGGDFFSAWGGIASLQLGLSAMWTAAAARGVGLVELASWMAAGPAALVGLQRRKGYVAAGRDADLVVWDPGASAVVDGAQLQHRHPVTPYTGRRLRGAVRATYLRGRLAYRDGDFTAPRGELLAAPPISPSHG